MDTNNIIAYETLKYLISKKGFTVKSACVGTEVYCKGCILNKYLPSCFTVFYNSVETHYSVLFANNPELLL